MHNTSNRLPSVIISLAPADSNGDGDDAMLNEVNVPITDGETLVAISSLKNRKACGHDNVTAEILKASGHI